MTPRTHVLTILQDIDGVLLDHDEARWARGVLLIYGSWLAHLSFD